MFLKPDDLDDKLVCECGASYWRIDGDDRAQCKECARFTPLPRKLPPPSSLKFKTAEPPVEHPFVIRLVRETCTYGADYSPLVERFYLYEGVNIIFAHLVEDLGGDSLWFPADRLGDFLALAELHSVTVEIREERAGGGS